MDTTTTTTTTTTATSTTVVDPQVPEGQVVPEGEGEGGLETFPISLRTCTEKKNLISLQVTAVDNLQDIKQFLYESVDACYVTNYNLYLGQQKLNEFAEIGEIPELVKDSVVEMRESNYDERSIRFHVRRLREIISSPESSVSPSLYSKITKWAEEKKEDTLPDQGSIDRSEYSSLPSIYPAQKSPRFPCLTSLVFSGWNPPPGTRKLMGDLLYLEITTLEKHTMHVTGSCTGFWVNRSTATTFNPLPAESPYKSHTLVGLLQKVSPLFKKNFQSILTNNFQEHVFEMFPIPFPVLPWVCEKEPHKFDLNRAEDALLFTSETDMRGQLRDWNEEYQSCKELPNETIQDRIIRDRAIVKINFDFVEAATKGACAIIDKTIPPINPLDPEKAHMYIYNNIFFSYSTDGRDFYKEYGGDKAAYASVNNDLNGIRSFNRADVRGLHTLATAIIDYRGQRLCAQSIIPGILHREQTSTVVYGSIDNGKVICGDPKFHELLCNVGKELGIREHTVIDSEGKEVKLATPVESKGIVGTDGRYYILDLIRATPRDTNFTGKENIMTIVRPELVVAFIEISKERARNEKRKARKEQKEKEKGAESKQEEVEATGKQEVPAMETPQTPEEAALAEQESEEDEANLGDFSLNPNALCDLKLGGMAEEIARDEDMVRQVSALLVDTIIPMTVNDLLYYINVPVDGQTLTTYLHTRGINMRYLGMITSLSEKNPVIKELGIREMITRAAKHIMRDVLKQTEDQNLSTVISHFFNCLLGEVSAQATVKPIGSKKKKKKAGIPQLQLTSQSLWEEITKEVEQRFQYKLPVSRKEIKRIVVCLPTLRALCQKMGVQVHAREYNFEDAMPFQPEDIMNLFPLVKHCNPESSDGKNLLEIGKAYLGQGQYEIALDLLSEALAICHQVYGPMHRDTANCYGNLAMVLHHAKKYEDALSHQQKSTIINERVLGLDHHDTAHSYGNLALLCHNMSKHNLSIVCLKRALLLGYLASGPNHPDVITSLTNVAVMLQDISRFKDALQYLLEALKVCEELFGSDHIQTASIYHAVAVAHSQLGEFKEALAFEKKNYTILHAKVGDNDPRTLQSNVWLNQFTKKAVQDQKTKLGIASQLAKLGQEGLVTSINANAVPPSSTVAADRSMGLKPLTEILQFINGKAAIPGSSGFLQRNRSSQVNGADKKQKKKGKGDREPKENGTGDK